VIAVMAAGNRDPERFPDSDRLDLTRKDNLTLLGWAADYCFGAALARIEGQIALSTLACSLTKFEVGSGSVAWRFNLGLRGLNALPVTF